MERKAHRGRLWKISRSEQFLRGMWRSISLQGSMGKEDMSGCRSRKTRRNTRSVATRVSLIKKFSSKSKEMRIQTATPQIMRRACNAKKSGNWERFKEEFRNEGKLCEWTFERLHEAYDKVAMEDIGHFEYSAGNSKTEHRLLEKDHRADVGCGRA